MHYLLSNDDGYQGIGLRLLAAALREHGDVSVVAPERDRSGASNSLTLDAPIHTRVADNGFIYINGTPTDCVHLAMTGLLLDYDPDIVLSGINAGENLGDDVLYSGTVAAAMEARFLGCPAIALSLAGAQPTYFDTAVRVALQLVEALPELGPMSELLLNVNVPDVPYNDLNGFEVTRLGNRHKSESAVKSKDPRGRTIYWVGPAGAEQDAEQGTDFYAIKRQRVSVTPLQVDLTKYSVIESVGAWVDQLRSD